MDPVPSRETIRVVLVEDNPRIREGLSLIINASPGFECVATFDMAEEAMGKLPALAPDVVLMDIQLPGMSGIECIRELKRSAPGYQILMLTVFEDHDRIFRSLSAGASGYLLKNTPPARLLEAIRDVHDGGAPMSNQIARRVVEAFRTQPAQSPDAARLSNREREILELLSQGFLYKEIAGKLGISLDTVRTHIRNTYEKLHVRSRTEAVLKGLPR